MKNSLSTADAAKLFADSRAVLIITHERPDGDAVGSAFGLREFLRDCGKKAEVLLPSPAAHRYCDFAVAPLREISADGLKDFDFIAVLDCASRERVALGDRLTMEQLLHSGVPLLNLDHHKSNNIDFEYNLVVPDAAAASQLAAQIALADGRKISARTATLWLLGIVTDTGAFRFSNTIGNTLRVTAELLDRGAKLEDVVNAAYFSKPRQQQLFECKLLERQLHLHCDGAFAFAYVPVALMREFGFDMRDGEGLIDHLREIDTVKISALCHLKDGGIKVSLRSKDQRFPVEPLARKLGGGGHAMAAAAVIADISPDDFEQLLTNEVSALLGGK